MAQGPDPSDAAKARSIVAKAVQSLGGDRYLQVKSQVGRGKFSVIKEGTVISISVVRRCDRLS